jgi:seryl-tRNA synthetase
MPTGNPESSGGVYMLDIKKIRENPELVKDSLTRRGEDTGIVDTLILHDEERSEDLSKLPVR